MTEKKPSTKDLEVQDLSHLILRTDEDAVSDISFITKKKMKSSDEELSSLSYSEQDLSHVSDDDNITESTRDVEAESSISSADEDFSCASNEDDFTTDSSMKKEEAIKCLEINACHKSLDSSLESNDDTSESQVSNSLIKETKRRKQRQFVVMSSDDESCEEANLTTTQVRKKHVIVELSYNEFKFKEDLNETSDSENDVEEDLNEIDDETFCNELYPNDSKNDIEEDLDEIDDETFCNKSYANVSPLQKNELKRQSQLHDSEMKQ